MKRRHALAGILIFFVAGNTLPGADTPAAEPLDYEQAARIALSENLDLAALRLQSESLDLKSTQALSPNNPILTYNQNNNYSGATAAGIPTSGHAAESIQLTWTIAFPGKSLSQSASLRHQSKAAREQSIAKEIDTLAALSNNFVALAVNERLFRLLSETRTKSEELVKLLEKKYVTAQAAQVDLLNAKVTAANLTHDLLVNRDEHELLLTQFRNLIRRPGNKELVPRIPEEIALPQLGRTLEELRALMARHRHQMLAAKEQVEAAEAALTTASLAPLPDFQLMVAKNRYAIPRASPIDDSVTSDYSFGVGIAIPLFYPLNEMSGMRAARRDRDVAKAQHDSQDLQSQSDLQSLFTHFNSASREVDNLTGLVLPAAKSAYDLMRLTYSLGKADYFRLNESRNAWFDAEKTLLAKKQDAAQTFNQLVQQVGCDFTKPEGPYACR